MPAGKSQASATLRDLLIDGFENDEIFDGCHGRNHDGLREERGSE